jgi:hypothetical protein
MFRKESASATRPDVNATAAKTNPRLVVREPPKPSIYYAPSLRRNASNVSLATTL